MTSLLTARRRAEEFATLVDAGASGPGAVPVSVEVAQLLPVVATLATHEEITPRPEFAAALRESLLAEAQTVCSTRSTTLSLPVRRRTGRERRLVAAASTVALVGGTATMAAAGQGSLPGEALYPVKRGVERVEASLSLGPAGKGEDLLAHAETRLAEVHGLLAHDPAGGSVHVAGTLTDFTDQADEGSALLLSAFRDTGDRDSVRTVRVFTSDAASTLEGLADAVPGQARDELTSAAVALRDIDQQAVSACGSCLDLPVLDVPAVILAGSESDPVLSQLPAVPVLRLDEELVDGPDAAITAVVGSADSDVRDAAQVVGDLDPVTGTVIDSVTGTVTRPVIDSVTGPVTGTAR